MPTLEGEGARHVAKPPLFRDPQTELGVLADAEGLVEEPDIVENGAADDNRGRHDRPVVHEVVAKLVRAFGIEAAHRDDAAVRRVIAREIDEIAIDEADLPAACESGELALELLRRPEVVSVQEGDELASRLAQGAIARGGLPQPRRLDDPELLDLAGQPLQHDSRPIS